MAKRQASLQSLWVKKARCEDELDSSHDHENLIEDPEVEVNDKSQDHHMDHEGTTASSPVVEQDSEDVLNVCAGHCSSDEKGYQPVDRPTLDMIATEKRNFQPRWYKQFPWLTVCLTYKKVFCFYCRYAT